MKDLLLVFTILLLLLIIISALGGSIVPKEPFDDAADVVDTKIPDLDKEASETDLLNESFADGSPYTPSTGNPKPVSKSSSLTPQEKIVVAKDGSKQKVLTCSVETYDDKLDSEQLEGFDGELWAPAEFKA